MSAFITDMDFGRSPRIWRIRLANVSKGRLYVQKLAYSRVDVILNTIPGTKKKCEFV